VTSQAPLLQVRGSCQCGLGYRGTVPLHPQLLCTRLPAAWPSAADYEVMIGLGRVPVHCRASCSLHSSKQRLPSLTQRGPPNRQERAARSSHQAAGTQCCGVGELQALWLPTLWHMQHLRLSSCLHGGTPWALPVCMVAHPGLILSAWWHTFWACSEPCVH